METQIPLRTRAKPDFSEVRLGVVCPMANESATAVEFVDAVLTECNRHGFEWVDVFVVVDHVSRDDTRARLEAHEAVRPQLHVVWADTQGVADAYVHGYRNALAAGCDWILEIDAGFSHQPSDIEKFLEAMAAGNDCVFGSRFGDGARNLGTRRRRAISRGGTILTNALLGTNLSDMTSGFQLFTREALEAVLARGIASKGPFFQTEMKTHCRNLRIAEVAIRYEAGSHRVDRRAVTESFVVLGRLFRRRLRGDL